MNVRTLLDKIITDAEAGERAPGRALARPRLRPYLPDRHALKRLIAGLAVLTRALFGLLRKALKAASARETKKPQAKTEKVGPGTKDAPGVGKGKQAEKKPAPWDGLADWGERAAIGALGVLIAGAALGGAVAAVGAKLAPYLPVAAGVALAGLLIAAWIVAPDPDAKKRTAPGGKKETAEPVLDAAAVAYQVRRIATAGGWKGAHLDDLLAHLPGRSRAELLDTLTKARIPVEEQLKLTLTGGRQRNRQGVRLSALPAGLGEAPQPPPQTPPQRPAQLVAEHLPESGRVTVHGGG